MALTSSLNKGDPIHSNIKKHKNMLASNRKGHTQIASFSAARFRLQVKERILPTGNHQDDDGCAILFKSLKL